MGRVLSWILPRRAFPFRVVERAGVYRLLPRSGMTLPPGLRPGDRLPLLRQFLRSRLVHLHEDVPSDVRVAFTIVRHGQRHTVVVRTAPKVSASDPLSRLAVFREFALLFLGVITLWWGRDWAAWGLAVFFLGNVAGLILQGLPWTITAILPCLFVLEVLYAGAFLGLYLSARSLVGKPLRPVGRETVL